MLSERDYTNDVRVRPYPSATIAVLVLNIIVYGIQYVARTYFADFPFDDYFALSLQGLKSGFIWQLLTYQFMHGGWWHIFLNSWAIFIFGRVIERTLGKKRMLILYFSSGIVGGLVQIAGAWLLPGLMDDVAVVGASAGAFGLVAAFATLFPDQLLYLLLFFVIPIKMRAKTLLWISIIIALVGIIFPLIRPFVPPQLGISLFFDHIGHAAHLGGILTGWLFARTLMQRSRAAASADRFY